MKIEARVEERWTQKNGKRSEKNDTMFSPKFGGGKRETFRNRPGKSRLGGCGMVGLWGCRGCWVVGLWGCVVVCGKTLCGGSWKGFIFGRSCTLRFDDREGRRTEGNKGRSAKLFWKRCNNFVKFITGNLKMFLF